MGLVGQRRTPPQPRDESTARPAPLAQQKLGFAGPAREEDRAARQGKQGDAGQTKTRRARRILPGESSPLEVLHIRSLCIKLVAWASLLPAQSKVLERKQDQSFN